MWKLTGKIEDRTEPLDISYIIESIKVPKEAIKRNENISKEAKDIKNKYNITYTTIESQNKKYTDEKSLTSDMCKDVNSWINKMLSSKDFEEKCKKLGKSKSDMKRELDLNVQYSNNTITTFECNQDLSDDIAYFDDCAVLLEDKYFDYIYDVYGRSGGYIHFTINTTKLNNLDEYEKTRNKKASFKDKLNKADQKAADFVYKYLA